MVIFSLPLRLARSFFCSSSLALFSRIISSTVSSGLIYTVPLVPSTIARHPSISSSRSTGVLTKAGMPIVLARIAVWEFVEPCTVTKASTLSLSNWTVSDGARSSAIIITGSSPVKPEDELPLKTLITRSDISFTSAARSFI